ncbi:murein hydrolase activator EnvC family protein [Marinithermofilum abyssi]|nr:M23 family metallopeptidase [Marinithermofilum abyssi]
MKIRIVFVRGRFVRSLVVAVTAVSLMMTAVPSQSVEAKSKEELEKELDNNRTEQGKVKKDIAALKRDVEKKKSVLSKAEKALEKTEKALEKTEKDLKAAQKDVDRTEGEYKKVVRSMYINGQTANLESLLSAGSINEFLTRFEFLRLIVKRNYQVVKKYYDARDKVLKTKAELEKLQKKQKKEAQKAQEAFNKLMKEMQKNQDALKNLEHEESITKQEIQELGLENLKSGNFPYQGPLMRPVNGPITSGYGYRGSEFHTGIDFGNDIGTPIYAAANGKVIRSQSCSCGYGYYIMIDHGGGIFSLYAHMWATQARVSVGDVVRKGQQIAAVGNNGRSTGPHLHFEVHRGSPGNYTNPLPYME